MKQIIAVGACLLAVNIAAKAGDLAQAMPPPPLHPRVVYPPPVALLPPYEAAAIVRSIGLRPVHPPLLRGATYAVRAIGPTGELVRVIVDARIGRVVRIVPVMMPRYAVRVVPAPYGRPLAAAPLPDRPHPNLAELPPGLAPAPGYGMPPGASRAPAANGAPPPALQMMPLPRPRPKAVEAPKQHRPRITGDVFAGHAGAGIAAKHSANRRGKNGRDHRGDVSATCASGTARSDPVAATRCAAARATNESSLRSPMTTEQNESAPESGALPRWLLAQPCYAALASTTLGWPLPIWIWRGFLASGISRTSSTCRSPFSRVAPLTWT